MNKTSEKTKRIINWVLTGLVAFVFLGSAAGKLFTNEEALKMATSFGLDAKTYTMLGIVELVCAILFIIPRTGIFENMLLELLEHSSSKTTEIYTHVSNKNYSKYIHAEMIYEEFL